MGLSNKEVFWGYSVIGACIMSDEYLGFLLEENYEQAKYNKGGGVKVRFCTYDLMKNKGKRWGMKEFETGWASPIMAHSKQDEFIVVDRIAKVFYNGLGKNKQYEKPLNSYKAGLFGLKNIHGTIYGATSARITYKRIGPDNWIKDERLKNIPGGDQTSQKGFRDIDGFSENDIYAVGGDRDVWHLDEQGWSPVDISRQPFYCTCVVCAEDGYVYIGGRFGAIARGRGDEWETYYPEELTHDIESIASYRGRIFVGTQKQTCVLGENLIPESYDFEGQLPLMAGHYIYTAYDRLLIANNFNQVAFFDGEKWLNINGCEDMTADEASLFMNQNLEWLEKATDDLEELTEIIQKGKK
ncbi:hypothetical protein VA7868_03565 [Vibrio aerogenes CECT 7868]|uniref:Kelch motif protein n=1 Tax=Vibrio aerogenes CECT 7868 TaxID=1216006 RepID=A0A1M6AFR9_9VIBR|nr:hypothetical protein [Vibrio aerogenes]SHI35262.1 hypothetical protein VA7868_03565 [Vibrio aerogenes CECT 7868]